MIFHPTKKGNYKITFHLTDNNSLGDLISTYILKINVREDIELSDENNLNSTLEDEATNSTNDTS